MIKMMWRWRRRNRKKRSRRRKRRGRKRKRGGAPLCPCRSSGGLSQLSPLLT